MQLVHFICSDRMASDSAPSTDVTMNEVMNFADPNFSTAVMERLKKQREVGSFCDIVFQVETYQFEAHRSVLAAWSPFFESMLKRNKVTREVLYVPCKHKEVFETLLDYLYMGKICLDKHNVSDLLKLANHYTLHHLKSYCQDFLGRILDVTNCFQIKDLAERCALPTLVKTAESFFMANIVAVIRQAEIQKFGEQKIQKLLLNRLLPLSEEHKLHLICHWVRFCPEIRHLAMPHLLSTITWKQLGMQMLYDIIHSDSLFQEEWCLLHFLEKFDENDMLYPAYVDTLVQLRLKLGSVDSAPLKSSGGATGTRTVQYPDGDAQDEQEGTDCKEVKLMGRIEDGNEADECCDARTAETIAVDSEAASRMTANLSTSCSSERTLQHKRKGAPVEVNISKAGINMRINLAVTQSGRKRGRPRGRLYSKTVQSTGSKGQTKGTAALTKDTQRRKKKRKVWSDTEKSSDEEYNKRSDSERQDPAESQASKAKRGRGRIHEEVTCLHCPFVGRGQHRLDLHVERAHKEDVTYECSLCDFTSTWNKDYYKHMKEHFTGPPYTCDFEGCDYTTERIQPVLNHRLIHTDARPHVCDTCSRRFRTRNNLITHYRLHTGG